MYGSVPILGLVDADPYGLDILSVYRFGSSAMAHECGTSTTPTLKWIGLKSSEIARYVKICHHIRTVTS